MSPEDIFNKIVEKLGEDVAKNFNDGTGDDKDPWFEVDPYSIVKVGELLKSDPDLHFDFLECLTGVDFPEDEQIQVVYHIYSCAKKHRIVLKAMLDRADPVVQSLVPVWPAANWQERECYDMLGVVFEEHPDLRRLLMPDDWVGYPLRKDYKEQASYHGIPTTRPNTIDLLAIKPPVEDKPASEGDEEAAS